MEQAHAIKWVRVALKTWNIETCFLISLDILTQSAIVGVGVGVCVCVCVCVCVWVVGRACVSSRGDFGRHALVSLICIFFVIAVIFSFCNYCNSNTEMLKK